MKNMPEKIIANLHILTARNLFFIPYLSIVQDVEKGNKNPAIPAMVSNSPSDVAKLTPNMGKDIGTIESIMPTYKNLECFASLSK